MAHDHAVKQIVPVVDKYAASAEFPSETVRQTGDLGLMGIAVPAEFHAADAAHGAIMSANNSLYACGILAGRSAEQKIRYITPAASCRVVGMYALTEPRSGSDSVNMRVRAVAGLETGLR